MKINNHISILVLLFCAAFFTACEDNRMNDMEDDKIYLLNPGLNEQTIFNWPGYTYKLGVIKSGMGQQGGEVALKIDEALLVDFNEANQTDLKMLPQELVKINNPSMTLKAGDYRAFFEIELNTEEIAQLIESTGEQYALPFQMEILSGNFKMEDQESMYSLLVPAVNEPYIEMEKAGLLHELTIIDLRSPEETMFVSEVQINYNNQWDIEFAVATEGNLVEEYNALNNTNYKVLNESAYKIDPSSLTIPIYTNKQPIKITFVKEGFSDSNGQYQFGDYLLPVKLTSVSKNNINPEKAIQYIPVSFRPLLLDRSEWVITEWNSCICEEPQYEGLGRVPENLLDGNGESYWGSKWDAPKPFPYYFIFDMQKEHTLHQIDLVKPTNSTWRGNIKAGYFESSNDGENWTKLRDWEIEDNVPREHQFTVEGTKARYVKLVITEAFVYRNAETGAESGAQCDLAEFVVWGE